MREQFVSSADIGSLGVRHLKRYWWRRANLVSCSEIVSDCRLERALDYVVLNGLGIGLEQAARFVSPNRTFAEFEAWIREINGGEIDPVKIGRINAAITGEPYDTGIVSALDSITSMPPVLTRSDLALWERLGVVVLHKAISPAECAAAANAVYEAIGATPGDPETWYRRNNCQGIMVQLYQHAALEAARTSHRIHKAFSQLWGSADLLATTDRCGFNPPEREGFTFPGPYLHWDMDFTLPTSLGVQALLYLTDTSSEQGAFCCVPGFHKIINSWRQTHPASHDSRGSGLPQELSTPIAGSAGDLIIWHHALPHGSCPNWASKPRVVQYLKMFPARLDALITDRVTRLTSDKPPVSRLGGGTGRKRLGRR